MKKMMFAMLLIVGCQCSKDPVLPPPAEVKQPVDDRLIVRYQYHCGTQYETRFYWYGSWIIIRAVRAGETIYNIDQDGQNYINTIHTLNKFTANNGTVNLTDIDFCGHFRTAEAMVIAAEQNSMTVLEPAVYAAGQEMLKKWAK